MTVEAQMFSMISSFAPAWQMIRTGLPAEGMLAGSSAGRSEAQDVPRAREPKCFDDRTTKLAEAIKYGGVDWLGTEAEMDIVCAPDLWES